MLKRMTKMKLKLLNKKLSLSDSALDLHGKTLKGNLPIIKAGNNFPIQQRDSEIGYSLILFILINNWDPEWNFQENYHFPAFQPKQYSHYHMLLFSVCIKLRFFETFQLCVLKYVQVCVHWNAQHSTHRHHCVSLWASSRAKKIVVMRLNANSVGSDDL